MSEPLPSLSIKTTSNSNNTLGELENNNTNTNTNTNINININSNLNSNRLPSLDSILVKIQSEQRQPLPAPSTNILPNPRESSNSLLPSLSYSSDPFLNKLPSGHFSGFPGLSRNSLPNLPSFSIPTSRSSSLTGNSNGNTIVNTIGSTVGNPLPSFLRHNQNQNQYASTSVGLNSISMDQSSSTGSTIVVPRKYRCKVCSKTFTTSGHLARHNRIHTGVKNHICPHDGCGARFSRQDNCMQHYKTHLNKKGRKRSKITPVSEISKEIENDSPSPTSTS